MGNEFGMLYSLCSQREGGSNLRITHVKTRVVRVPTDSPLLVDIPQSNLEREFVTLELGTDPGLVGVGLTSFGGPLIGSLKDAVETLATLVVDENPLHVEAVTHKLRRVAGFSGPAGIFALALSALDIALWDIKGKAFDQPLYALLGGYRDRVPAYASGALSRSFSIDSLVEAAQQLVNYGFRQLKMQLGGEANAGWEVERVQAVRDAIGEEIDLMGDVNQRWSIHQAIQIGSEMEQFRLFWLEDPVAHDDFRGMARVSRALAIPIATGEYHYGLSPFRELVTGQAADVIMIDLLRIGGITQWLKVAALAEAFNLPVVSHLLPEVHVHLVASIPNGLTVEYMPWALPLFEETPLLEEGQMVVPQKPGLGLTFDSDALRCYEVT
jgi:L-alanine-DL-glutamate epimerase-like enolase superfamily enzyme